MIEFEELRADYWWVSFPIDLTKTNATRIIELRLGTSATRRIGTITKRGKKFYFYANESESQFKFEWPAELLQGIVEKLNELNKECSNLEQ